MPPTVAISCPALGISLAGAVTRYSPGDVIIGHIYRTTPTVAPHARLTVTLYGRSESCMIMTKGMASSEDYGCLNFFDPGTTTQILHSDKPLHIEAGSNGVSWPFVMTIPSSIDYDTLNAQRISQNQSFLSLEPGAVAAQPLPSSFRSRGFSSGIGAYVEYVLEAELEVSERGKTKTSRAALPVQVIDFVPGPPVTEFLSTRRSHNRRIVSQRLVPGLRDGELSFSQKAQQFIGSSKLPNFAFKVHVELPTLLQIGNKNCMPLRIGIEPLWDSTTEMIRDVPQRIKIESLAVRLDPSLRIKSRDFKASDSKQIDIVPSDVIRNLEGDVYMAWGTAGAIESNQQPRIEFIELGELLDFRLGRKSLGHLYPSFTTYNIQHSYKLSFDLRGVFDDEKIKVISNHEVNVLPPSRPRDRRVPPSEYEPPPSFAQSQLEARAGV